MARGIEGNEMSTPKSSAKKNPPSSAGLQSGKTQKSILGFFQRKSESPAVNSSPITPRASATPSAATSKAKPTSSLSKKSFTNRQVSALTPVPSSDALEPPSSPIKDDVETPMGKNKENGLVYRTNPVDAVADDVPSEVAGVALSSPGRKV